VGEPGIDMSVARLRIALLTLFLVFALPAAAAAPDAQTPDGGRYYGPLVDGRMHGTGRIEWDNGSYYRGAFAQGLYSGTGVMRTSSGEVYRGQFRKGLMAGRGRLQSPQGSVYVGEFRNDAYNGRGRYQQANGDVYEGTFKNGKFDGQGRLKTTAFTYEGEFRQGEYSGRGETVLTDGHKYHGEYLRGRFHGKGRYETAGADVYEGEFADGEFAGTGTYALKDGRRYEGRFVKWELDGPGRFIDTYGNVYEGQFTRGSPAGSVRFTAKSGAVYEGEFSNWMPNGQGTLRLPNGDGYQGAFARGLYEGAGTLTYAKPQADARSEDKGTWRYGQLRDEARERQAYVNVETALYNQRALLDRALHALKPRDPSKINLYLLAIGGDGSQEVFRREVEFVRDQFDSRFRTEGRSIVLVNSRSTVSTAPMATVSSIRETLKALASKMDRENDILFLFMTSHGSEEHEFTLSQNNMRLRGLKAKELAQLLAETQIRWKVVVVSACYSGGFIDPISNDSTLVMTAARHDRRSFGCADNNDFTYFGRAFFKEALPASDSFPDAFRRAEALIRTWETTHADGPAPEGEYSLPQISAPAAVTDHLRRWWSEVSEDRARVRADAGQRNYPQDLNEAARVQP